MLLLMLLPGLLLGFLLGFLLGVLLALLLGLLLAVLLELLLEPLLELQQGLLYHIYKKGVSDTRKIKILCPKPDFPKTSIVHTFFNDFSKLNFI